MRLRHGLRGLGARRLLIYARLSFCELCDFIAGAYLSRFIPTLTPAMSIGHVHHA